MKTFFKTALALAITSVSTYSLANGLAINEQSASSAGTAYAGRSSSALDASTIYGNPAGLTKLKRMEVSGGFAVIDASTDISGTGGNRSMGGLAPASGTNKGDMVPFTAVPFGYFAMPLDERWSIGLGIYVPFGVHSDYEKNFQGAAHGLDSKVSVITIQPTIAYKFNDEWSLGFGPTINRIDGRLTSDPLHNLGMGAQERVKIEGDDTALGYNIGLLWSPTERTNVGLTYHSKVEYKLKGHTKVSGVPPVGLPISNGKYKASLDITMPDSVDFSITHQLNARWTAHVGAVWTRWSRLESLDVENKGMANVGEELHWEDTWSYAAGVSYQLNKQWVLRTGLAVDPSPTSNEHRNVRIPVGNRKIFTLGAGWSPNDDITVDMAYAYLWESEAGIHQYDSATHSNYDAKFENKAHGFTAQMTYRF